MATQLVPENLNTTGARLPAAYEAAKSALMQCASIDECQSWANKAQALASYARQADDDTLQKQAMRIQSRAVRRCGELLKDMRAPGARSDLSEPPDATVPRFEPPEADLPRFEAAAPRTATEAARDAGMSERQQKTAIRVANVPAAHFEAAVESDEPPTVTRLADMGRQSASPDAPVPPGFQAAIQMAGFARRLAEFAGQHEAATVAAAVADYNRRELRSHVAKCRRYLTDIAKRLGEHTDGL